MFSCRKIEIEMRWRFISLVLSTKIVALCLIASAGASGGFEWL